MNLEKKGNEVAQSLKNITAKNKEKTYNELRVIVAIERVVARLEAESELAEHLVFKGGFVLLKKIETPRFTKDLDALALGLPKQRILSLVQRAIDRDLGDGLWYGKIMIEELRHVPYPGIRFRIPFQIGTPPKTLTGLNKLTQIHIDIVVGAPDETFPAQQEVMPSILGKSSSVSWLIYPPEYIFSEKLETLVSRGSSNSRAKDIYDLVQIFPMCHDQSRLVMAMKTTFSERKTQLPPSFYEAVFRFDVSALKRAWPNVGKSVSGLNFSEAWDALLQMLKKLDLLGPK